MFHKKTICDVPLDGQIVLLRADYNVPFAKGRIANDYRLTQSLSTLRHLINRGCRIVICSHLGRPKGHVNSELSLEPIAARLGELLKQPVGFIPTCIGDRVVQAVKRMQPGQIILLENVRFHPQEEKNDPEFAELLAKSSGAGYFVEDGFGVVHRAHASTEGVTHFIPSVAGLLLEKEVTTIQAVLEQPQRPLVAILGGAKVTDKIKVIERFVSLADQLIIGGAMANTFLKYKGYEIGKSIHEDNLEPTLESIYKKAMQKTQGRRSVDEFVFLPIDVVVTKNLDEGSAYRTIGVSEVEADDYIVDLGGRTAEQAAHLLQAIGTAVWSGTLGKAEQSAYAKASERIAQAMAERTGQAVTVVGGGDTVDFVLNWDKRHGQSFSHVSTGGSASLELMAGDKLPGIEALLDK